MKSHTLLLLIVCTTVLVGFHSLSASWTPPPSPPTDNNPLPPINVSTSTQEKKGNFMANVLAAATSTWSPRYCDALGNNCFTPATVANAGGPVGSVVYMAGNSAPSGYLIANGQAVSRTTYSALFAVIGATYGAGDGSTTFNLPDLRGEFIRGWDAGRGADSGRGFGTWQADEFRSHAHLDNMFQQSHHYDGNVSGTYRAAFPTGRHVNMWTSNAGGAETRPRNVALLPVIKF